MGNLEEDQMSRKIGDVEDSDDSSQEVPKQLSSETTPPPDGGILAWTQVALMHLVFFNTWGIANGFGVFQEYYTKHLPETQSTISWIGSVAVFFVFSIGVAGGRATDAGYFNYVFALGVFLQLVGIFMTSLGTQYWQIFLAQAVCTGLGNGCTFVPAFSIMSSYFKKNRAFAVGLAASGAATGGLVYPVLIDGIIDKVGFAWTMRAMGLVMLATQTPGLIWFTPRLPPRKTGPLVDWSAFKEPPFVFFTLSNFFAFWGLYFAFFYMGTFARDRIGVAEPINLVMVLNGVGIIGRILPGVIADRWTGMFNLLVPLSVLGGMLVFVWAKVDSEAALYAFAIANGFIAAALQSLYPAIASTLSPQLDKVGTRVGMIFSVVSLATLTGPAICGELIQRGNGDYLYAQIFAGSSIILGAVFGLGARIAKGGTSLRVRV